MCHFLLKDGILYLCFFVVINTEVVNSIFLCAEYFLLTIVIAQVILVHICFCRVFTGLRNITNGYVTEGMKNSIAVERQESFTMFLSELNEIK